MKLKLITRPELPEPEVTIASAPKDKEAELIVQALQGIGNTLSSPICIAGLPEGMQPA